MNITVDNITPFLDVAPTIPQMPKMTAWLTAISAQLTATFGGTLPDAIAPAVYNLVADAIARRLTRGQFDPRIKTQSTGPSSVGYNTDVTALSGWFYPDEANLMSSFFSGGSGVRSYRTPAPDGIRYGNSLSRDLDELDDDWAVGL
jgi:hypothetical protein